MIADKKTPVRIVVMESGASSTVNTVASATATIGADPIDHQRGWVIPIQIRSR